VGGEGFEEPGASELPIALDGADVDAEFGGGLVAGDAGEEEEFDDLSGAGVFGFEFVEELIEEEEGFEVVGGGVCFFVGEFDADLAAASAEGDLGAGVLDEDAAHLAAGEGEEVGGVVHGDLFAEEEADDGFVDEGGGLEGVVVAFVAEEVAGDGAEGGVDEGEEAVEGVGFVATDRGEQGGDFAGLRERGQDPQVLREPEFTLESIYPCR